MALLSDESEDGSLSMRGKPRRDGVRVSFEEDALEHSAMAQQGGLQALPATVGRWPIFLDSPSQRGRSPARARCGVV